MATSAWSTEAWTNTQQAPSTGVGQIFYDDFASYSVGQQVANLTPPVSVNGATWWGTAASEPPKVVAGGYGGDANALGFRFENGQAGAGGTSDAYCEQRYKLCDTENNAIDEMWQEYYIYWPSNFQLFSLSNNKCVFPYSTQFNNTIGSYMGDFASDCEMWPAGGGLVLTQNPLFLREGIRENWGHARDNWSTPPIDNSSGHRYEGSNYFHPSDSVVTRSKLFWHPDDDNGQWRRYRFHWRAASNVSTFDGLFEAWKDDTKIVEIKDNNFCSDTGIKWDSGGLFGWFNSGVVDACTIKMSRFSIYDSDRGWV